MTAPGKHIPGYLHHAWRVAVGHRSSLWRYCMLVNQPSQPSHHSQAWKLSGSLPLYNPACLRFDSQVTRQCSGTTGTAPLMDPGFLEHCLAYSGNGPLHWQLSLELQKPRELYKSGRQLGLDNRQQPFPNLSQRQIRMAGRLADYKTESLPVAGNTAPPPQPHRNHRLKRQANDVWVLGDASLS
ncbi:hypothetical protein P7K49_040803 [Saguinus oedipus]|uniref:Uncharacterized protein n=2 Tax=Saguinus oedipus TaxID=9490 RepID=A0ABQ9TC77_SAGOE|nr:hypothetical protein P7K49_040634 [Saguinus oedipus]KAK2081817.1 hypothetical protein P7K49_040803 [Saguinus oedipus]